MDALCAPDGFVGRRDLADRIEIARGNRDRHDAFNAIRFCGIERLL